MKTVSRTRTYPSRQALTLSAVLLLHNCSNGNSSTRSRPVDTESDAEVAAGSASRPITGTNLDDFLQYDKAAANCRFSSVLGKNGGVDCQTANILGPGSAPHRVNHSEPTLKSFEWVISPSDRDIVECPTSLRNVYSISCSFKGASTTPVRIGLSLTKGEASRLVYSEPMSPSVRAIGPMNASYADASEYMLFISSNEFKGNAGISSMDDSCRHDLEFVASANDRARLGLSHTRAFLAGEATSEANLGASMFALVAQPDGISVKAPMQATLRQYLTLDFILDGATVEYAFPLKSMVSVPFWSGFDSSNNSSGAVSNGASCSSWTSQTGLGAVGMTSSRGKTRFNHAGSPPPCDSQYPVLCIAW